MAPKGSTSRAEITKKLNDGLGRSRMGSALESAKKAHKRLSITNTIQGGSKSQKQVEDLERQIQEKKRQIDEVRKAANKQLDDLKKHLAQAKASKTAEEDAAERARLHKLRTGYDLIPKPKERSFSIIGAANLSNNPQLYLRLRGAVDVIIAESECIPGQPWSKQPAGVRSWIIDEAMRREEYFRRYGLDWAVERFAELHFTFVRTHLPVIAPEVKDTRPPQTQASTREEELNARATSQISRNKPRDVSTWYKSTPHTSFVAKTRIRGTLTAAHFEQDWVAPRFNHDDSE